MNQWKIGDQVIKKITATDEIVREIARISGDINPVHLDDRYAKKQSSGKESPTVCSA